MLKQINDYLYYFIIAIVSIAAIVFLPLVGSSFDGAGFKFPSSASGWIVFVASKLAVATINVLLFHSFIQQAKINVKDDPNYIAARKILADVAEKQYIPRSERDFNRIEYSTKFTSVGLISLLSVFSFGQAILEFDAIAFLSYIFTVLFGIIFGVLEMKKYEDYYTREFFEYAKYFEERKKINARDLEERPDA